VLGQAEKSVGRRIRPGRAAGDDDLRGNVGIASANLTNDGERRIVFEFGGENNFVLRVIEMEKAIDVFAKARFQTVNRFQQRDRRERVVGNGLRLATLGFRVAMEFRGAGDRERQENPTRQSTGDSQRQQDVDDDHATQAPLCARGRDVATAMRLASIISENRARSSSIPFRR